MKDHAEIGHLTKYDVFRVNGDQVMDLEILGFHVTQEKTKTLKLKNLSFFPSSGKRHF